MLRRRFMGDQDAVRLILDHQYTVVRPQRVGAVNMTLRRRGAGQQVLQHLLWRGQVRANGIHPAFDRRLGNRNQEQDCKEERTVPEADPADHREVTGQPNHAVAHRLGGRDALDRWCEVSPLLLAIQGGPLRDDASVQNRMVKRREFMHIDVGGVRAPPERCLRPQLLVKVVLAQSKHDHRRAIFPRRAHTGVLVYLRDSRGNLHLYHHRHLSPFTTQTCHGICGGEESVME